MSAPLTHRTDLVCDQRTHPPHGTRRPPGAAPPVRLGVSGSGAELLVLAWSAADLARERAAGTLRTVGGAGHFVPMERPAEVSDAIAAFLG